MESVIIPFEMDGVPASVSQALQLAKACDVVADAADRASDTLRKLNRLAGRSASNWLRAAQSAALYGTVITRLVSVQGGLAIAVPGTSARPITAARGPKSPPRVRALSGPAAALARAQSNYAAFGGGNDPAAFDAGIALQRARTNFARAQKGPQSPIMSAIMTSRFGVGGGSGGGAMPLVGRTLSALGPYGVAAAAIVMAGASLISGALERGSKKISLAFDSGSAISASRLGGLAGGLGFDAGAAASAFHGGMGEGPLRVYAARAGVNPYSGEYGAGNQDPAGSLDKYLRHYADPTKATELDARMAGRHSGLSAEIAKARAASPEVREKLFAHRASQLDPLTKQATANTEILSGLAMSRITAVGDKLGSTVLPVLASGLEALEPALTGMSDVVKELAPYIKILTDAQANQLSLIAKGLKIINDLQSGRWGELKKDLEEITNPSKKKGESAADKMERAAKEMGKAAQDFRDGVYGNGAARARQSLPNLGPGFDNPAARQAINLGSIVW